MIKGQRKANGNFELSEAPSHLIRRCQQFYGDLYAREAGAKELTKQQFILLCALEQNDGASQTALVEITGIDRSTLAEMVRRMLEKGLLSRERTEEDQRANAVAISPSGRKALRAARNLVKAVPLDTYRQASMFEFVLPTTFFALARFGKWDELLREPAFPSDLNYSRAIWHYARGRAFAAKRS